MKGYHISFIRHGRTAANDKGIYIGRTDYPLSAKGASELYNKLDQFEYPRVAKVYSSPLLRCTETAEILFPEVSMQTVDNLMEMNFGEFEGKSADELVQQEAFRQWLKGGADSRPPQGESLQEVQIRLYKALRTIIRDMMETDILHAAVITHAGILTNLITGFGLPKIDPKDLHPEPGEGYEVLVTASLWQRSGVFEVLGMTPYQRE